MHVVICAGSQITKELLHAIAEELRNKEATSITIHKPTAVFEDPDGRRRFVSENGTPLFIAAAEGVTTC